jgi:hypothetical protein
MSEDIGRRDLIKLGAGAALASQAYGAGKPKFLTPDEFALVDELSEMIIPADEKSGGAKAARVAEFIDSTLAEAFEQAERDTWRNGLMLVNSTAAEAHGTPFLKCTPEQRVVILTRMSETKGSFFHDLKALTIRGYYTSKVGIHDDLGYLGNTYQREEFAGYLPGEQAK